MILGVQQTITITSAYLVNDGAAATFMLAASRSDIIIKLMIFTVCHGNHYMKSTTLDEKCQILLHYDCEANKK